MYNRGQLCDILDDHSTDLDIRKLQQAMRAKYPDERGFRNYGDLRGPSKWDKIDHLLEILETYGQGEVCATVFEAMVQIRPSDQKLKTELAAICSIHIIDGGGEPDSGEKPKALVSFTNALALVVGVGRYAHIRSLAKPANDARSIQQMLVDPGLCGYVPDNVRVLVDGKATKKAIRDGLQWLADKAGPTSTVFLFFSGHGGQDPANPVAGNYLLPYDCAPFVKGKLDAKKLSSTSISSQEFTEALKAIHSQKLVVVFDCCHSGGVGDASRDVFGSVDQMREGLSENYYEALAQGKGRVILASCLPDERSWERSNMHNGIFTTHLLAALRGRAGGRDDGLIHILDVFRDLQVRVPPDAAACRDPYTDGPAQQHPFLKAAIQDDFGIALDRGGAKMLQPVPIVSAAGVIQPIAEIRSLITGSPGQGIVKLIEYLADKPEWSSERPALELRLAVIKQAAEQEHRIGMITPALEAERRLAIHFALSVCWDIEDKIRSSQAARVSIEKQHKRHDS
jgi:hypothetical protein